MSNNQYQYPPGSQYPQNNQQYQQENQYPSQSGQHQQYPPGMGTQQQAQGMGYPSPASHPNAYQQPYAGPNAVTAPRVALPETFIPDDRLIAAEYERVKAETANWGTGGRLPFLKFPGPQGELKWGTNVPINFESKLLVHICPPWAANRPFSKQVKSHFWKSATVPQGTSISCPGVETCLVCQARNYAISLNDPNMADRAKKIGRVRQQYLYNVISLNNLDGHYDPETGKWRPFLLGAGSKLHGKIWTLVGARGAINIVHPEKGRPVWLIKRKTGYLQTDVEYDAIDMDPAPLDEKFWVILHELHDLDAQDKPPSQEDMLKAVQDMGLPIPPQAQQMGSYNSVPPPAYPNPYGQSVYPNQAGVVPYPRAQDQMTGVSRSPQADPYEFPPRDAEPLPKQMLTEWQMHQPINQNVSNQMTASITSNPNQMGLQTMSSPMAPPPIYSTGNLGQAQYSPQPGQGQSFVSAPPPPETDVFGRQESGVADRQFVAAPPAIKNQTNMPGQTLSLPLAPGTTLPGGRERCYGKYNAQDRMCSECPEWLRMQCQTIAGVSNQGQAQSDTLQQMQDRLAGK